MYESICRLVELCAGGAGDGCGGHAPRRLKAIAYALLLDMHDEQKV
jgi:hypothetical protein